MEQTANELVEGIRTLLAKHGIPGIVNQAGPVFHMMFTDEKKVEDFASFNKRDSAKYSEFAGKMLEAGVLVRSNGLWYVSAVHGKPEVSDTLAAVDKALAAL
ncbi:hypothetical protein N6H14_21795 [Paenibacillus sp. CC-CFT747]|nr:hypothetical protein N6H14_21795 [Paenibacillus sp. CC-CFT747]